MKKKKIAYELYGKYIGDYQAEVCPRCGEEFYDEDESRKMEKKVKQMGLWGLESKTKIGQSGSTLDIRLSKKIIDFLGLKKGKEATVRVVDKKTLEISF